MTRSLMWLLPVLLMPQALTRSIEPAVAEVRTERAHTIEGDWSWFIDLPEQTVSGRFTVKREASGLTGTADQQTHEGALPLRVLAVTQRADSVFIRVEVQEAETSAKAAFTSADALTGTWSDGQGNSAPFRMTRRK